jgi:hypothetical protein
MTIKHHCLRNGVFVFICFILEADALAVKAPQGWIFKKE